MKKNNVKKEYLADQKTYKFKEVYQFIYNDINIFVKIDYRNNKISLVEPFDKGKGKFKPKDWLFADRGVEFMEGWINILKAMQAAVEDAKKRYEADLTENSKFLDKQVEALMPELLKIRKK